MNSTLSSTHSQTLTTLLQAYEAAWLRNPVATITEESAALERFHLFAKMPGRPYDRDHFTPGHVTGSALVCTEDLRCVLLTHHKKLDKWLQLGGHSDGDPDTAGVAMREAFEESGLSNLEFFSFENLKGSNQIDDESLKKWLDELRRQARDNVQIPFDIDAHDIPARKNDPAHIHFDLRFLVIAKGDLEVQISDESNDLKWMTLEEARLANSERSMLRQFDKIEVIRSFLC